MSEDCDRIRFLDRVTIESECWIYQHSGKPGKGRFRLGDRFEQATKAAYSLFVGDYPARLKVTRTCRNKDCVRPEHLAIDGHSRAPSEPFEDRFLAYVEKSENGCWAFTGHLDRDGYGRIRDQDGRLTVASRVAYRLWKGEVPADSEVCHTCDNPTCVNPDHLWLGTTKANQRDKWGKGRAVNNAKRGEEHPRAKLTASQVIELRKRSAAGEAAYAMAKELGISDETVRRAINGDTWKHINETKPDSSEGACKQS